MSMITSKANRILGMIKRSFTTLNPSTLLLLYKHPVRPSLEYCNIVWNLGYLTDLAKLEKVQRRATRMLKYIRNWNYEENLHYLNLPCIVVLPVPDIKWICWCWRYKIFWSIYHHTYQGSLMQTLQKICRMWCQKEIFF